METISRVIVSLVYYNSLVRDTLEYTLNRPNGFDVKYYDYKRNGIVNEIKLNTPLKVFLDHIKKASDGLRVDHAQNVKIFESTIPLHEELTQVIRLHVNYARQHNQLEDKIVNLVAADERFYRAVALLALSGEIDRQFAEFNKAMRESKGQATPASNFIQNDLNTLVRCLATVRQGATCKDELYTDALDAVFHSVEMMNGRRDLPKGKTFQDVFNEANIKIAAFVRDSETEWRNNYTPCLNELIADNQKARENAQQAAPAEENKETK